MIEPCGRRWSAIGLLRTQAISRSNMKSTARMPCSIIRNRASGSGAAQHQESRTVQPSKKRFTVRRIIGGGDLWVTEFILTYDGIPSYSVSIMEFRDGLVAHETQYFADQFDPDPRVRILSSEWATSRYPKCAAEVQTDAFNRQNRRPHFRD